MYRLAMILLFSSFGGAALLHFLKNFLLQERAKFRLDWDGVLERLLISYIILAAPALAALIPLAILAKALFRLFLIGLIPGIAQSSEPGSASQKVLLKAELAYDLLLSPAFAILVGVLFR